MKEVEEGEEPFRDFWKAIGGKSNYCSLLRGKGNMSSIYILGDCHFLNIIVVFWSKRHLCLFDVTFENVVVISKKEFAAQEANF